MDENVLLSIFPLMITIIIVIALAVLLKPDKKPFPYHNKSINEKFLFHLELQTRQVEKISYKMKILFIIAIVGVIWSVFSLLQAFIFEG